MKGTYEDMMSRLVLLRYVLSCASSGYFCSSSFQRPPFWDIHWIPAGAWVV
jgi:hypothetical protein